ncbi:MAG: (Fe-S)-binding protein [Lacipirellulaceae bacterium]
MDYSVVQQCMHCGMCLPTCPTFVETGRERSSPRGRIALMRAVADGRLELSRDFAEEMDYCVGCLACQTACPAGVEYAQLLETARATNESAGLLASPSRSVYRWLGMRLLFTRPRLLRWVARLVAVQQLPAIRGGLRKLGLMYLAPKTLRDLEPQAPPIDPPFSDTRIKAVETPQGAVHAKVGLLTGCIQDIVYARVNRATADVLLAVGAEVHTPRVQTCCGSLHAHNGDLEGARLLARRTLDMFREGGPHPLSELDAVISNSGGCGSHLRHFGDLLKDDPQCAEQAHEWDAKLRDAHEFVAATGAWTPPQPTGPAKRERVTYDASCHLCHGQKVVRQPIDLLKSLPDFDFVPLAESDWCCGAAGVYTITQPEQAQKLLDRKLGHLRAARPDVVATANPGCMHQLTMACAADETLKHVRVMHPMELLAAGLG